MKSKDVIPGVIKAPEMKKKLVKKTKPMPHKPVKKAARGR